MEKKVLLSIIFACIVIVGISYYSHTQSLKNVRTKNSVSQLITSISVQEFKSLIDSKSDQGLILDLRTEEEFLLGHIKGATLIDFYKDSFQEELSRLDKEKTYYIYCRSGGRSGRALNMMKKLGFTSVYNLDGGILRWKSQKYLLVP